MKVEFIISPRNKREVNQGGCAGATVIMKSLGKTERYFGCNFRDQNEYVKCVRIGRFIILENSTQEKKKKNKGKIHA